MAEKGLTYKISLLDGISKPIKGIVEKVETLNRGVLAVTGVGAAFAGATGAITHFVDENLDALDTIHQLRNVTGETVEYIYELGKVAEVNGSSSEAAQRSIEGLSKVIGEAAKGAGKGAKAFKLYGLSVRNQDGHIKKSNEVIEDLMLKMEKMSKQEQIAMLSKLGIDPTMIQTLRLGNAELDKQRKYANALTLGVATDQSALAAANFKDAMTRLGQVLKAVREYIAVRLAPTIQNAIELFENWLVANNELVKESLETAVKVLGKLLSSTFAFFTAVDRVIASTIGWKNALYGLVGMFAIVKAASIAAFVSNPITWVAGAIIGLILILDDLFVFMKGGKSYFGEYWQKMFDIIKNNKAEIALFGGMFLGLVGTVMQVWFKFGKLATRFTQITGKANTLITVVRILGVALRSAFMKNPIGLMITAIVAVGYAIYKLATDFDGVKAAVGEAWDWMTSKCREFYEYAMNTAFVQGIISAFESVSNAVGSAWDWLKSKAIDFVNGLISLINNLPGVNVDLIATGADGAQAVAQSVPQPLATSGAIGGMVTGAQQISTLNLNPNQATLDSGKTVSKNIKNSSNVQITVNAKTGANPQEIAREIDKAIKANEFKQREQQQLAS
ncbi:hypothetical protein [Actinobacillus porcinus]|uniref:hypothetical protein n=1 Tax=Actinobacillus porcinus TaxID=51048 RepID=UPI002A910CEF|nr:hypothetical protein [Actinobacillus porcinus]MDY6216666.1 hypothetical protein [Actinobacillus porcinus]